MIKAYNCHLPKILNSPIIFNSPHSGRLYESKFLKETKLSWDEIRLSEDCYVDNLLDFVTEFGCVLMEATFPRAFVDVNRSSHEMDPKIIKGLKKTLITPRIAAGLGVIPRLVGNGKEIYKKKISLPEANYRLKNYYFPYHEKLKDIIDKSIQKFGLSVLVDFHSMPHNSIQNPDKNRTRLPQVILGDCFGASCHPLLVKKVYDLFVDAGFRVEMNNPFSGGFITQNYGTPLSNIHVIQVELDRSLYMNEANFRPHEGYADIKKRLRSIIVSFLRFNSFPHLIS